ncbi:MAG: hypothetical protein FWE64_01835 [Alphaproteobacteria bacterium]|nr:hypothetical protein [Alphaproteobacteria bacterium]
MKRIFIALFSVIFLAGGADATGQIANVEFIHMAINKQLEGLHLSLPMPDGAEPTRAANVKYMLCAIDRANEVLNDRPTSEYCEHELATTQAIDTVGVLEALSRIRFEPLFWIRVTVPAGFQANIEISAYGAFIIDWGDGLIVRHLKNNTNNVTYSHVYEQAGTYVIGFGGVATSYASDEGSWGTAAIGLGGHWNSTLCTRRRIVETGGDPSAIFPIRFGGGFANTPRFNSLFENSPITYIPNTFFKSMTGAPVDNMFESAFRNTNITSIPADLFARIQGAPTEWLFASTFRNTNITSIPGNLFYGINGAPAPWMFDETFADTNITSVPETLFSGIQGPPAEGMFSHTFFRTNLTSVPGGLFSGISGAPADWMFLGTFRTNPGLTGPVPVTLFSGISGPPAEGMFEDTFRRTSITSIPGGLFSGINGPPAERMFLYTFNETPLLTVPSGLFSGINGPPARHMFNGTFSDSSLTSIPAGLFSGISGPPAVGMFSATFYDTNLSSIPSGLFDGIVGAPQYEMFFRTFWGTNITSIPTGLFSGITGPAGDRMFMGTFMGTNITSIPSGLFSGITGPPNRDMFRETFRDTNITSIPSGLFSSIIGPTADWMFAGTFQNTNITSVPGALFSGISGQPRAGIFEETFADNSSLVSIGDGLFDRIHGIPIAVNNANGFNGAFNRTFANCPNITTQSARTLRNPDNPVLPGDTQEQIDSKRQFLYQKWSLGGSNMRTYQNSSNIEDFPPTTIFNIIYDDHGVEISRTPIEIPPAWR